MIRTSLFDQEAKAIGVTISTDLIRDQIRQTQAFRNSLGEFDQTLYQQSLVQRGIRESRFVAGIREDMRRRHLLGVIDSGATAPSVMVDLLFGYLNEKRTADVLKFSDSAMAAPADPGDDVLTAFHKENERLFRAPEYRKVTFVNLSVDEIANEATVAADRLKEASENRRSEFIQPERRQLEQMMLPTEADAKKAEGLLSEGRSFAAVAKEVAGVDAANLALGQFTHAQLAQGFPELADPVFALNQSGATKPIKSPIGWHIANVVKIDAAIEPTFAEVRPALAKFLARETALDGLFGLANKLEDSLGGGATLEESANQLGLGIKVIPEIDQSGRDRAGKRIPNLPDQTNFVATVFQTSELETSLLKEYGTDGYYILRVDGLTPSAIKPIADIRGDVLVAWQSRQRSDAAKKAAADALERAKGGIGLDKVAADKKVPLTTTVPFTRQLASPSADLPQALATALFRVKSGEAAMARGPGAFFVARLKEIKRADPFADKNTVEALKNSLLQGMRQDLQAQYAESLGQRFPINVNNIALEQLFQ
jgi:peptidyl-prolyl cis-trans isomerase D